MVLSSALAVAADGEDMKHGTEVPTSSTMTTLLPENPLTNQATTTIPPWQEMPRSDANLPLER
jgi:hypothetical protein